jgi:hypothetical protein
MESVPYVADGGVPVVRVVGAEGGSAFQETGLSYATVM